jgi:IS30 family transposase
VLDATKDDFADLPARLCISMTYDNGKEFSKHEDIEKEMGMTVCLVWVRYPKFCK